MLNKLKKQFTKDAFLQSRVGQCFGSHLNRPYLWKTQRHPIANGTAIGFFCAFTPVPLQMLCATILCLLLRGNLIIANLLVWVLNPLPIPPMMYVAYATGNWLLHYTPKPYTPSLAWLKAEIMAAWYPYLIGMICCGLCSAFIAYALVQLAWGIYQKINHNPLTKS